MKPSRQYIAAFLSMGLVLMTWTMTAQAAGSSTVPAPGIYGLRGQSVGDDVLDAIQGRGLSLHDGEPSLQQAVILWDEPQSRNGRTNQRISIVSGDSNRQGSTLSIANH